MAPNGTNPGLFRSDFSAFGALEINLPSLVPRERQIDEETGNTFLIQGGGFCFVFLTNQLYRKMLWAHR